jgi:hypothetical protein
MTIFFCLFSTFINLYYNPKNISNFFKKNTFIFMVFYWFLCCLFSVLWRYENMILNDLRFDFHGQSNLKSNPHISI